MLERITRNYILEIRSQEAFPVTNLLWTVVLNLAASHALLQPSLCLNYSSRRPSNAWSSRKTEKSATSGKAGGFPKRQ